MSKNIYDLDISEENKILISKIEKRISFLSTKSKEYLDKSITISSKKIEDAYLINKNLITIANEKNDLLSELKKNSFDIRQKHQINFNKEINFDIDEDNQNISLIQNTLDKKDSLVNVNDKMFALSKIKNYIINNNRRRKQEMNEAIETLEARIKNDQLLDIAPMLEDIKLIKKFINPKEIGKTKYLYLLLFFIFLALIIFFGGFLWLIII